MNPAKAIELAMVATLRQFAELGKVELRAWQSLPASAAGSDYERHYPCVPLTASAPIVDDNGITLSSAVRILCATLEDDDKSHARVSSMYDEVERVCSNLYKQVLNKTPGVSGDGTDANEIGVFEASLAENAPTVKHGGFEIPEGLGPEEDQGVLGIGVALVVHYSRTDF